MNYKLRTNKAFTLIELVVAIAILVMVISFAGVIFKVSINSHRTATASAEIMRKLRAITDQFNECKGFISSQFVVHSELFTVRSSLFVVHRFRLKSDYSLIHRYARISAAADGWRNHPD